MGRQSSPRNRFLGDRLWDDQGREWHKQFGWLSHDDIGRLVTTTRVAVHTLGGPVRWLSSPDAQQYWTTVRPHTQDGQQAAASADDNGLAYAAARWTSAGAVILVFVGFC